MNTKLMKFVKPFAALAACALASFTAAAYTANDGGYTWTYQLDGGNAVITKGSGQKSAALSPNPSGVVTLPSALDGHKVSSIGYGAFYNTGLTDLVMSGVPTCTSIGDYAFAKCASLTGFAVNDSVTTVGSYAFSECTGMTTLTMGSGVRSIGSRAFQTATSLKSVTIPDSVTSIGERAFESCSSLATMTIGSGVTAIPTYFASGCAKLANLMIGSSVASIGKYAFNGCSSLDVVTIPLSVTELSDDAFLFCSSLDIAYVPVSLKGKFDESGVFGGCAEDFRVVYYDAATVSGYTWYYTVLDDGTAELVPAGAESLAVSPAPADGSTLVVPDELDGYAVSSIGKMAFMDGKMASVVLPDTVATICQYAFYKCGALERVTMPSALTSIGERAFCSCKSLASFDVPDSVTSIEISALAGSGIESFSSGRGVTALPSYLLNSCPNLHTVTIHRNVRSMGIGIFYFSSSISRIMVDNGDTERVSKMIKDSDYDVTGLAFEEDTTPYYIVRFHRDDASDEKTSDCYFDYGVATQLPTLRSLGWARRGLDFLGWATSRANADAGKVWKADGAAVSTAAQPGKTLDAWAVWAIKSDSYALEFVRNDGAGTWRTVGFRYGAKTRMPSLAKGLGWARRGYDFMGWELTTADANDNTRAAPWKGDWAYVSTPTKKGSLLTTYARWKLKPGCYQIRFNKNDGTGRWRTLGFEYGKSTKLSTISGLGWTRPGYTFKGWASSKANADAGKVWKLDGAWIKDGTAEGKTLSIYAIWQ